MPSAGANVGCGERVLKRCVPEGGGLELTGQDA